MVLCFRANAGIACACGAASPSAKAVKKHRSHIGIVSREFQVPCIMGTVFVDGEPARDTTVEVDCSAEEGIVRG